MFSKTILIGKVVSKVESKIVSNGNKLASFRVITNDPHIQYHNINAFEKAAESALKYNEGDMVYVEGKIVTRKYKDQKGADKYITSINASRIGSPNAIEETETQSTKGVAHDDDF